MFMYMAIHNVCACVYVFHVYMYVIITHNQDHTKTHPSSMNLPSLSFFSNPRALKMIVGPTYIGMYINTYSCI
jgi:hypothetical protein